MANEINMKVWFRIGLLIAASTPGCTGRQIYESAAGWRQNECQKILENTARAQCMETAGKDYDSYRKEQASPK